MCRKNVFYFVHDSLLNARGPWFVFFIALYSALWHLLSTNSERQKRIGVEVILSSTSRLWKSAEGQSKRPLETSLFFPYNGLRSLYARDSLLTVLLKSPEDRGTSTFPRPGRRARNGWICGVGVLDKCLRYNAAHKKHSDNQSILDCFKETAGMCTKCNQFRE